VVDFHEGVDFYEDSVYRAIPVGTISPCDRCGGPTTWDGGGWVCDGVAGCRVGTGDTETPDL
jgi:hypothetical protein